MSRLWQIFVAPGPEEEELPLPASPWHIGRLARLPHEHWERIIEVAGEQHSEWGKLLEQASALDGDFSTWTTDRTRTLRDVLSQLCKVIAGAEPLVREATYELEEAKKCFYQAIDWTTAIMLNHSSAGNPIAK
jgi:hypothetical protein